MEPLKAYGLCGSLRKASFNYKLLNFAGKLATEEGITVKIAAQSDMNLPLYNADIEQAGFPQEVLNVIEEVKNADMLFLATPEYNYSLSPILKNALDWCSRFKPYPMTRKTAVLFGASNGHFGTIRTQFHWRQVFTSLNLIILPQPQVFMTNASDDSFLPDGTLKDQKLSDQLKLLIKRSAEFTLQLKSGEIKS